MEEDKEREKPKLPIKGKTFQLMSTSAETSDPQANTEGDSQEDNNNLHNFKSINANNNPT